MDSNLVQILEVNKITPYARNPRKNDEAVSTVKALIQEFGFLVPILVDKANVIIAGHTRLKAALELGLTHIPVIRAEGLTPEQVKAFRILENKSHERAMWDAELLQLELSEIDIDLEAFDVDFDDLEDPPGEITEDEIPEPKKQAISQIGDLWVLGGHRLLCGDCTDGKTVKQLMGKEIALLCNTDPPYGISYSDAARVAAERAAGRPLRERKWDDDEIENDELDGAKLQAFLEKFIRAALPSLAENAAWYLWHPMLTQGTFFAAAAAAADILIHRQIIWVKPGLLFGFGDYHWKHELCFYGWRKGRRPEFYGERNQTTVWQLEHDTSNGNREHPTQKPVALFSAPILNHTKPSEVIYEPFCGSGSQIIAAEQLERRCFALDIEPLYVDVAIRRWQTLTGKEAHLEDGKTFSEVAKERGIS